MIRHLRIWQTLFVLLLIAALTAGFYILPSIKIDTNLADISPKTDLSEKLKFATDALRSDIEKRIMKKFSDN